MIYVIINDQTFVYITRSAISQEEWYRAIKSSKLSLRVVPSYERYSINTFLPSTAFIFSKIKSKNISMKRYIISDEIILAWYNISIRHDETLSILRCLFRRSSIRGLSKRSSGSDSLTRGSKRKEMEEPEPIILRSHWTFTAGGMTRHV